jgi:hypothetical protein
VLIPQIKPVKAAFPGLLITNYLFLLLINTNTNMDNRIRTDNPYNQKPIPGPH